MAFTLVQYTPVKSAVKHYSALRQNL